MIHKRLAEVMEELEDLYQYANKLIPNHLVHSLGHKKELLKQTIENAMINALAEVHQSTNLNGIEIEKLKEHQNKILDIFEKHLRRNHTQ